MGVKTVQCEDEIAGCASAVGAAFAGDLAVTTTSGPGVCLKSEAMNLAVIAELPLVVINVQRGDLLPVCQPNRNKPTCCKPFTDAMAKARCPSLQPLRPLTALMPPIWYAKIALEHMTPVVLLTDAFIANGSAAWKLPDLDEYPAIKPPYVTPEMAETWTPFQRNEKSGARYWAVPGTEGFMHRIGGLERVMKQV